VPAPAPAASAAPTITPEEMAIQRMQAAQVRAWCACVTCVCVSCVRDARVRQAAYEKNRVAEAKVKEKDKVGVAHHVCVRAHAVLTHTRTE
jgi:hypothetical protein